MPGDLRSRHLEAGGHTVAALPLAILTSPRLGDYLIPLWTESYVPVPLVAGRAWFEHCGLCGLDVGGQHYDGCPWLKLVEAHAAADWSEAEEASSREYEERRRRHVERERNAARYDR